METDTTNSVVADDTALATVQDDTGVAADDQQLEPQFDEFGNPIEEPDEDEEFELDENLKLKVPKTAAEKLKELKEGSLRQADYTRKTQELAEQRKAFDAERQNIVQATNEELSAFAQASTLGQRLAAYQQVNWAAWNQQAQANYDLEEQARVQAAFMDYQQVKDQHANALGTLSRLQNQRVSNAQQEAARRIEEGRAALAREIGWNDDLKAKLTDYALGQGLSRDDLADLEATPAAAKILKDAFEWRQHQTKQQAAKRHETAQQVQPAATVSAKRAPPAGLDDRLGTDEWIKRRNAQLAKRA